MQPHRASQQQRGRSRHRGRAQDREVEMPGPAPPPRHPARQGQTKPMPATPKESPVTRWTHRQARSELTGQGMRRPGIGMAFGLEEDDAEQNQGSAEAQAGQADQIKNPAGAGHEQLIWQAATTSITSVRAGSTLLCIRHIGFSSAAGRWSRRSARRTTWTNGAT